MEMIKAAQLDFSHGKLQLDRVVRNERGELFIETPDSLWSSRLAAWKLDQALPCPMPKGHIMFRKGSLHYQPMAICPICAEAVRIPDVRVRNTGVLSCTTRHYFRS